ncbi:tRNA 2-thiocytidine biosynthesis protein TtcA [Thermotomaculum hydrothermale]|uniref:tRNA 2-thiocytidine biosynthesis protein TtcA n=1 Tax=Thermotomaculum hydrothermale TaxID=981385 RepID=A0A7R6PX12_9BACT|nr:ATP-binding protein [Thermotomaculum hydrothermale]BBB32225.1 tRNA 2-thiocytidine biosynthesis protein TtcA [Thermotomaculum hydrothermale]
MKKAFDLIVRRTGKAIGDFKMIEGGDKVAVGISGGKDSLTLYLALRELQRKAKEKYKIVPVYLSMNNEPPKKDLSDFFENLGEKLTWFKSDIEITVKKMMAENPKEDMPCRLCSRFRRAVLYERIKEIGCNKLALGHHMDDMVETFVMNMFFAGKISGMPAVAQSEKHPILLIRPMCYIQEELIIEFVNSGEIKFPTDTTCELLGDKISMRDKVKELINELKKKDKRVLHNAFTALKKYNFFHDYSKGVKD